MKFYSTSAKGRHIQPFNMFIYTGNKSFKNASFKKEKKNYRAQ